MKKIMVLLLLISVMIRSGEAYATPIATEYPIYGIIYDGNGADGGSTLYNLSEKSGEYEIENNGFFRSGYHDRGYWTDDASGKGNKYHPGDKIWIDSAENGSTIVLYAQWEGNEYVVDFDYNADFCLHPENLIKGNEVMAGYEGKSVKIYYSPFEYITYELSEDNGVVKTGEKYILPKPEMPGYVFEGWSFRELPSGNGFWGNYCTEETRCTITENHTLYAVWNPETYSVSFDFNFDYGIKAVSGINAYENISADKAFEIAYGENYSYLPKPEKEGYVFCGWYTEENENNGVGTEITGDDICELTRNHTLYAKWKPLQFKLFLDDDGNNTTEALAVNYGEKADGLLYTPERKGYKFIGWNEKVDGRGNYVNEGDELKYICDTHLYAVYEAIPFEVQLDFRLDWKRAAVKAIVPDIKFISVIMDQRTPELPKAEREGYFFNGWYVTDEGKKSVISEVSKPNVNWGEGLFANWVPDLVRGIYDYNEDYKYGKDREAEDE